MGNKRRKYTPAQDAALVIQVSSICPLCAEPLFYQKNRQSFKHYEIAHIYPLNPTKEEIELLVNEERLSDDLNDEDNVIPLCKGCHGKFDKPRTVEEYRLLYSIKKKLIEQTGQRALWKQYRIEEEIKEIIEAIYNDTEFEEKVEIDFTPRKIDAKFNNSITMPTKRKIKNNIQQYYLFIKKKLSLLDQSNTDLSDMISAQVKTYYLKQKTMGLDQQKIFKNIVAWIEAKTDTESIDAIEIIVSFFIQNCEVF